MIVCMRVDERLIHGQVAIAWSKSLDINAIVVANDKAAKDEMMQMTLRMATPQNKKLAIKSKKDAINLLHDPRCQTMKIFVLVDCLKDAIELLEQVEDIPYVNIGNYGRVGQKKDVVTLTENIFADQEDLEDMKILVHMGKEVEVRILPDSHKTLLKDYLKEENV